MTDAPTSWLIHQIQQEATTDSLWLSDENVLRQLPDATTWLNKPRLITNRWDIFQQAQQASFAVEFSDFDLSQIPDASVDHIFYRISKEKAVTHHLINESHRLLKVGGRLWLSGQKNEGIKTYEEKAAALFGGEKNIRKDGMSYSSQLPKYTTAGPLLDAYNYASLRPCLEINGQPIFSKPGQFGWNKIDQGSEFLITEVSALLAHKHFERCLDLGCGYGYLSLASLSFHIKSRLLTDNNAAALITAKYNCEQLNIVAEVTPSDAGQELSPSFDLILCNPPFHQGFSVDGDLTDKFLRSAQRLLADDGVAYFVVNQFIPLEKKAEILFKSVKLIAQNKSFKLVEVRKN